MFLNVTRELPLSDLVLFRAVELSMVRSCRSSMILSVRTYFFINTTHRVVKVDFFFSVISNGITDRHRCFAFNLNRNIQ